MPICHAVTSRAPLAGHHRTPVRRVEIKHIQHQHLLGTRRRFVEHVLQQGSRSGVSDPRIWPASSVLKALSATGGAGRARERANGSPDQPALRPPYPHADASAVNRILNVFADLPPHTNMGQPIDRSGS